MAVDQNGRDTRHPDAGPDAALAGSKGTTVKPPVPTGTVNWGQPGTTTRNIPSLPKANNELVTGLPFDNSHVPMGVVGGDTSTPTTTPSIVAGTSGVTSLEAARAAARRKAVSK
jgi:hypothetical protein